MPTILIADDDKHLVRVTSRLLEQEGFSVLTAADGEQALATARERRPDLLLLDIALPLLTGELVARQLRAEGVHSPVVFVSARDGDRLQGLEAELAPCRFIRKPADLDRLLSTVQELLAAP